MIEIPDLSKIGFGAYRIVANSHEQISALRYAIECGCNLIDTACNYTNGSSEELIGNVLGSVTGKGVFVVTKAGYLSDKALKLYMQLNILDDHPGEPVVISDSFKHSIHPDYLNAQIKVSKNRLKKESLDCFLLHSPEYYFTYPDATAEEYYNRIKRAFIFLEELAENGNIRYYGISSNSFTSSSENKGQTSLKKILEISREVSSASRFKFIQFPYNLIENNAGSIIDENEKSLIDIAKANHITTLSNRPLNSNYNNSLVRLEVKNLEALHLNFKADEKSFLSFFSIVEKKLNEKMPGVDSAEIPILQLLKGNWMKIENPDSFVRIFRENFDPLIELLFEEELNEFENKAVAGIENIAWKYHIKSKTENTLYWLKQQNKDYLFTDNPENFTANLITDYLNSGIDHVLLGMRKKEYVDSIRLLLQKK